MFFSFKRTLLAYKSNSIDFPMKPIYLFAVLLYLSWTSLVLGHDVETVYIDSGLASYCSSPKAKNAAVLFHVYIIGSGEFRQHCLPGTLNPARRPQDSSYVACFPLAWSVQHKALRILFPNLHVDAMGRISFLVWAVDDVSVPDINPYGASPNDFHPSKAYAVHNGITVYNEWHGRGRHFRVLSSHPFAFSQTKPTKMIWYDFDGTDIIARLPFENEESTIWKPCETPTKFQWMESRFSLRKGDIVRDEAILHSEDFPPDGFAPVGSVRIVGKRVLSDDPKAAFPQDAEWLIWESDGTAGRLCQMRGGRWTVCTDAPRTDAPKVIVVNNDSNTVMLCYSTAIDAQDIAGSMQRITDLLKERGVLEAGGERPE